MSQGSLEPEGSQGHPAWQPILDQLPEELRTIIKPELEKWDKTVQDKLQGLHGQYDPYKKFVESNVDPRVLEQSLLIANHLNSDPEDFVRRAIANFGIEAFVEASAAASNNEEEEEEFMFEGDDITKHPQFKQMMETVNGLQNKLNEQDQRTQAEREQEELDEYLTSLEDEHGSFDKLYVSTLMANGVEAPKAIEMFNNMIGERAAALVQAQQGTDTDPPPVVMGANGTAGSGTGGEPVPMGSMKDGQVTDLVIEMLKQQQQA